MPADAAMTELLDRMSRNARQFTRSYPSANVLLKNSVQEAMPWAMGLMRGRTPSLEQLERLATQILAILAVSYAPDPDDNAPEARSAAGPARVIPFKGR